MGFGEQAAAGNIAATLGSIQANFGLTIFHAVLDPSGVGAASMAIEAGFFLLGPVGKSAAKIVGSIFLKGRKFKVVPHSSSTVLGENLELLGSFRCAGCQAHHLIPGTAHSADLGRQILAKHNININSPLNGVFVKGRHSPAEWAGPVHSGRHLDLYAETVSARL